MKPETKVRAKRVSVCNIYSVYLTEITSDLFVSLGTGVLPFLGRKVQSVINISRWNLELVNTATTAQYKHIAYYQGMVLSVLLQFFFHFSTAVKTERSSSSHSRQK